MKTALTIAVAAAASFVALRWTSAASVAPVAPAPASAAPRLLAEIDALRRENRLLADEAARLASAPASNHAPSAGVTDEQIAAALERWRGAHPPAASDPSSAPESAERARVAPVDASFAELPIHEVVLLLGEAGLTHMDRQQLFQELRESGRIDEYVAEMERLAAADPENADLQVALGNAYLQKLFGVPGPEAGVWAYKSDAAFDRALQIDDTNWGARFTKAVSLANWPAFMGRGPEAIEHFETLLDQQSQVPPRPEFAMTYLFLGNILQANGEQAKALETWREGLELFPDVEDLQRALELAEESEERR